MGKRAWEELGESESPIEAVSPGKERRAGSACPFLHAAVLGEDGGSRCEMLTLRSVPPPPKEMRERDFCLTSPFCAPCSEPLHPSQPIHAERLPHLAAEGLPTPSSTGGPRPPQERHLTLLSPSRQSHMGLDKCSLEPVVHAGGCKGGTEFAVQPVLGSQLP